MPVDEISLRPCTLNDAQTLALVGAATFLEAFAGTLEGAAILAHAAHVHTPAAWQSLLSQPRSYAWLAEALDAPVGYVLLTTPDLPLSDIAEDDVELRRIYLFSRFHGNGNGQRMMDQAIAAAKESAAKRLLLGVYRENYRALAFYAKNGFVMVGTRTFQLGNVVHDDLVLGLNL